MCREEFDAFGRCLGALSGVVDEEQAVCLRAPAPDDLDPGGCVLLRRDAGKRLFGRGILAGTEPDMFEGSATPVTWGSSAPDVTSPAD